jgi:hypothetical protein
MRAFATALWKATIGPVYYRLFRRYFDAILSRLDELDAQVHGLLASKWEEQALARRIAIIEDRLGIDDSDGQPEPVAVESSRE